MRAVQITAPGKAEFVEVPQPALTEGHALVRTLLLSLCGSDVHMLHHFGDGPYPLPAGTSGHEMIGIVEAVHSSSGAIREGDIALTLAPEQTAMAEYYLADLENVLPLPPGKPMEHLLMAQQLGTVIYACRRLPNVISKDVAVIGQGSAGLFFDAMLRRMGAHRVIGIDLQAARVAAAPRFGASHAIHSAQGDPLGAVEEITHGKMVDVVIEAAGEVETINLAANLLKDGGHLLFFGVPRARVFTFDFWTLFRKYCYTTTSGASTIRDPGRTCFRMALDLIASGAIDVTPMLTHRLPFDRVMEGYELMRTRDDGIIKAVIEMPGYLDCHTRG